MADEMAEVIGAYRSDAESRVFVETGGMAAARHGNVPHSPSYRTAPHEPMFPYSCLLLNGEYTILHQYTTEGSER